MKKIYFVKKSSKNGNCKSWFLRENSNSKKKKSRSTECQMLKVPGRSSIQKTNHISVLDSRAAILMHQARVGDRVSALAKRWPHIKACEQHVCSFGATPGSCFQNIFFRAGQFSDLLNKEQNYIVGLLLYYMFIGIFGKPRSCYKPLVVDHFPFRGCKNTVIFTK